jgi:hypothetical protein
VRPLVPLTHRLTHSTNTNIAPSAEQFNQLLGTPSLNVRWDGTTTALWRQLTLARRDTLRGHTRLSARAHLLFDKLKLLDRLRITLLGSHP